MNDQANVLGFGAITEESTFVIQRCVPGPVSRIWNYLTDSDLRQKWLAAGDMKLAPGAPVELVWRNDRLSHSSDPRPASFPEEQRMQSHVIAVDPMRMLTIAWGKGKVTFELKEKGDKVLLTLPLRGLDHRSAQTMIAAGWQMHLDILATEAAGTESSSFWSGWTKLRAIYEERLPQ